MAYNFKCLPSEIIKITGIEAYCFDNACSTYINLINNDDYILKQNHHKDNEDANNWL